MIELREAVSKSMEVLKAMSLVPASADLELEEAELEEDGNVWTVTFSYPDPTNALQLEGLGPNLASILRGKRSYKAIRLLASDGSVRGIKTIHV